MKTYSYLYFNLFYSDRSVTLQQNKGLVVLHTDVDTVCADTDPEVSHGVDLHGLLDQRVWGVDELLSCYNSSIVHQNADVAHFTLHLQGGKGTGHKPLHLLPAQKHQSCGAQHVSWGRSFILQEGQRK